MLPTTVSPTPSVLDWAIRESGFSLRALATMLGVAESEIESWLHGKRLELTKLQALAKAVERPFSAFFLPRPPVGASPTVKFRSSTSARSRPLNPEERRRIREAARLQEVLSWLAREMELPAPRLPAFSTKDDPETVARAIRALLNVSVETQLSWQSPSAALRAWRSAIEALGVGVLAFSMLEESCRGFSLWNDEAPIIAVNTVWLPEARVFTLFHELSHLLTRTNSACAEDGPGRSSTTGDRLERWCERVSAAVIVPPEALEVVLTEKSPGRAAHGIDLSTVSRVAARFRVSRRAAALRLIEQAHAPWALYKSIPAHSDQKKPASGGRGRSRAEVRRDTYGQRTMALFRDALATDVVGPADVVDYLALSAEELVGSSTPGRIFEDE